MLHPRQHQYNNNRNNNNNRPNNNRNNNNNRPNNNRNNNNNTNYKKIMDKLLMRIIRQSSPELNLIIIM